MFVSVDTVAIDEDKNEAAGMKELLESELVAAGDENWKIVFGHFPCQKHGFLANANILGIFTYVPIYLCIPYILIYTHIYQEFSA